MENIKKLNDVIVKGLSNDKTYNVNITKPSGVRAMSSRTISVKVTLSDETTKEIDGIKVSAINLDSKYKAQAVSKEDSTVTVVVKGSSEAVNALDISTIKATVDLSGYSAGDHEVEVQVTGDDLKLSYESKIKKVNIIISENK